MGTTAAIVGGSVLGGVISAQGAKSASDAQASSADASNATQRYMYDKSVEINQPALDARDEALRVLLGDEYGGKRPAPNRNQIEMDLINQEIEKLGGREDFGIGYASSIINNKRFEEAKSRVTDELIDEAYNKALAEYERGPSPGLLSQGPGEFTKAPGYDVRLKEGTNQLENMLASRGMTNSGVAGRSLQRYGQDYASNEYDNFLNRYYKSLDPWLATAGLGQTSAGQLTNATQNAAANISQNQLAAGNARASGYINQANAISGSIGTGLNNYFQYQANQDMKKSQIDNALFNFYGF